MPSEKKDMEQEIDRQKHLENPDFKGAFHEKKKKTLVGKQETKLLEISLRISGGRNRKMEVLSIPYCLLC